MGPDSNGFMAWNYTRPGPAAKQRMLLFDEGGAIDTSGLKPYPDDAEHNSDIAKELAKQFKMRPPFRDLDAWMAFVAERKWGGVAWGFYGDILKWLEVGYSWPEPIASFFRMPVYACGYNWTGSNQVSGNELRERIDAILKSYKSKGDLCKKVMLVTHSMGGRTSRAACMLEDAPVEGVPGTPSAPLPPAASNVLGVIHGVQPVLGSPAAYWRLKAGWERIKVSLEEYLMAWTLGSNQDEVTAFLGNMPGGLQLLPNHLYSADGGAPGGWLEVHGVKGDVKRYPVADPYQEIYREENAPYRLVTRAKLLPNLAAELPDRDEGESLELYAGRVDDERGALLREAWCDYRHRVQQAKVFHTSLGTRSHPETHVFYGTEPDGAQRKCPTAHRIVFKLTPYIPRVVRMQDGVETLQDPPEGQEVCTGGDYRVYVKEQGTLMAMVLQQQDGPGDGTVPASSGSAVKPCGDSHQGHPRDPTAFVGVAHSAAYKAGAGRTPQGEDTHSFVTASLEKLLMMKVKKRG